MSSAPLAVPASPSSKRSRSRDSTRSAATFTVNTPSASNSFIAPSASAPSLLIPNLVTDAEPADTTPYPAFLRLSKQDLHQKFVDLEWEHRRRQMQGVNNGDAEHPSQWSRCLWDDAVRRNRYLNVDPYQANRVKLRVPEGHNDYINASPIELKCTKSGAVLKYIATQGPRNDTCADFWRMIWNETTSPACIVMLTQTHESGREKCYPYYPQSPSQPEITVNAQDEYEDGFIHNLKLVSLEDTAEAHAQIRELEMVTEDGSETKKISHLLFAGWPDFSVPDFADRNALLKLIEISREKVNNDLTNPRVVHCSAGVGRSGTFIALDWLLQELEEGSLDIVPDDQDPVISVVETLRAQRMMMVQSEAQLAFIYDIVRERWRERNAPSASTNGNGDGDGDEPSLKRQKSMQSHISVSEQSNAEHEEKAKLEAELMDAEMQFEKGKT